MSRIVPIFHEFLACPDLHLGLSKGSVLSYHWFDYLVVDKGASIKVYKIFKYVSTSISMH